MGSHARPKRSRGRAPAYTGRADRRRLARKVKRKRRRSAIKEIPLIVGVALIIALAIKTFLLQAFVIPSGSMEQTIKIGDRVVVDKLSPWFGSKPERGDVVVFKDPGKWLQRDPAAQQSQNNDPPGIKQAKAGLTFIGLLPSDRDQDLIKRVVGTEGDRVKCCDSSGRVTVNGTAITEPYLYPDDKPSQESFDVTVPSNRLFVMGDHRSNSADSRYHRTDGYEGTVPEENVVGKAMAIAWPFGHWRGLQQRDTYASVPDPVAGAHSVSLKKSTDTTQENVPLPTPAELPLVIGVVGLHRWRGRQWRDLRSGCGGRGSRRPVRTWRARGRR
ncbi:signal peptidase I [Streptomyces boninensis]|uniref:signal peptidase I n=1 Tax=Streptomyces boninensis TaxID=2039455 RepID=UPI003B222CF3